MVTETELSTVWVPVPLRWRHVVAGDVIVGNGGKLWQIEQSHPTAAGWRLVTGPGVAHAYVGDADEVVKVLVPATEADAAALTIEQLGARLIERRTA